MRLVRLLIFLLSFWLVNATQAQKTTVWRAAYFHVEEPKHEDQKKKTPQVIRYKNASGIMILNPPHATLHNFQGTPQLITLKPTKDKYYQLKYNELKLKFSPQYKDSLVLEILGQPENYLVYYPFYKDNNLKLSSRQLEDTFWESITPLHDDRKISLNFKNGGHLFSNLVEWGFDITAQGSWELYNSQGYYLINAITDDPYFTYTFYVKSFADNKMKLVFERQEAYDFPETIEIVFKKVAPLTSIEKKKIESNLIGTWLIDSYIEEPWIMTDSIHQLNYAMRFYKGHQFQLYKRIIFQDGETGPQFKEEKQLGLWDVSENGKFIHVEFENGKQKVYTLNHLDVNSMDLNFKMNYKEEMTGGININFKKSMDQ